MMRRRTNAIVSLIVFSGFVIGLGGTVALLVRIPSYAYMLAIIFVAATIAMTRFIGEGWRSGLPMGVVVTAFAGGALALHELLGVSARVALIAFGAFVLVLLVGILRLIVAAGSADYPYED